MTRATNLNRHSQYSTWAKRQAGADDVLVDTPDPATSFTATQQSATEINLAWTNPAGQATALMLIERAAAAGAGGAVANTFTDVGNLVTDVAHGLLNGARIAFDTVVTTTGVVTDTTYYVVGKTDDTFQVEATVGGGALTLTTDGSGTYYVPTFAHAFVAYEEAANNAFSDTGLTTGTEYEYRLTAINRTDQPVATRPLAFDTTP